MQDLMVGMFWGGVVMALAPVMLGIGIGVIILRNMRDRQERPD